MPPLILEDPAVSLSISENSICLIMTSTGLIYMWNLENSKCILSRISVRSLLSNNSKYCRQNFLKFNFGCDMIFKI